MGTDQNKTNTLEIKQTFLSNAISDMSTYIQLADTKVSIIMAAVVAILIGAATCYEPIGIAVANIVPCSWLGVLFIIFALLCTISVVLVFLFGILTVRGHSSVINYKSKWFLPKSTKEYSFDEFWNDVHAMTDDDIIKNMTAELYKLNDINRQKMKTLKWTLLSFSSVLITMASIGAIFLINTI
jgi:hypothetical protein